MRDIDDIRQTLCVIGSHDPLLDELSDLFHSDIGKSAQDTLHPSAMHLLSAHAGSMGGLMAIMRGEAQLAGIHLMDAESGVYNLPLLTRYFPDDSVVLVEGVRRMQGLLTSAGNPKKITGLSCLDRPGIRYVNRQGGSGTRILLDYQLDQLHIAPGRISGYTREEITHSGVAAQIAAGTADTGLAIMAAARLFGLEFIPVAEECYDFAVRKDILETPLVRRFLALLKSAEFRRRLEIMGGYRLITPGKIITGYDS
jgi:putative molybdopterin biosynthesis protein